MIWYSLQILQNKSSKKYNLQKKWSGTTMCNKMTLTDKFSVLYCQSFTQMNNIYFGAILPLLECHCWVQLHFLPQGGAMVGRRQTDGSTLSCFLCCCPLVWAAPAPDHWSSPFSSWGLWPASRRRVMINTIWGVECLQWCINIIRAGFSHLFTFNWTAMSQWRVKPIQIPRIYVTGDTDWKYYRVFQKKLKIEFIF